MDEDALGDGPSLNNPWKGDRAGGRKIEVVCCSKGEVAEEFEVADVIGAELKIADWDTVLGSSAKRFEIDCLYCTRHAEGRFFIWCGLSVNC